VNGEIVAMIAGDMFAWLLFVAIAVLCFALTSIGTIRAQIPLEAGRTLRAP
jgi:hypothetical protein